GLLGRSAGAAPVLLSPVPRRCRTCRPLRRDGRPATPDRGPPPLGVVAVSTPVETATTPRDQRRAAGRTPSGLSRRPEGHRRRRAVRRPGGQRVQAPRGPLAGDGDRGAAAERGEPPRGVGAGGQRQRVARG